MIWQQHRAWHKTVHSWQHAAVQQKQCGKTVVAVDRSGLCSCRQCVSTFSNLHITQLRLLFSHTTARTHAFVQPQHCPNTCFCSAPALPKHMLLFSHSTAKTHAFVQPQHCQITAFGCAYRAAEWLTWTGPTKTGPPL